MLDYDTLAAMSPLERPEVLAGLDAEALRALVDEHWRRALARNREQLTEEQVQFLESVIGEPPPDLERRMTEMFPIEIAMQFHFGAFKNSGAPHNPIAYAIARARPVRGYLRDIVDALSRLATSANVDAATYQTLAHAFDGIPAEEEFWRLVQDREVILAARRALAVLQMPPRPQY